MVPGGVGSGDVGGSCVDDGGGGSGENWDKMNRLIISSRRRITGLAAQDYTQLGKIQLS